jgi:hypothetical protein
MGKAKSYRQLEALERFHAGCSERIAACRGTPAAQREIADLQAHLDADRHLTPAEFADYRHRLAEYGRSCPVDELPFPPLGAA